jgi:hypothetical protein
MVQALAERLCCMQETACQGSGSSGGKWRVLVTHRELSALPQMRAQKETD